jgi:hypothetical protein
VLVTGGISGAPVSPGDKHRRRYGGRGDRYAAAGYNSVVPRKLFTVGSTLSLLLGAAVLVMWVRSYWRFEEFGHVSGQSESYRWAASSSRGVVQLRTAQEQSIERGWYAYSMPYPRDQHGGWVDARPVFGFALFAYRTQVPTGTPGSFWTFSGEVLMFPWWCLAALFSVVPLALVRRRWKAHPPRWQPHLCHCGYDLRASRDRCPECGTPIAKVGA